MEQEAAEKKMDDGEIPDGKSAFLTNLNQWEDRRRDDGCEKEDNMADFSSQETPHPSPLEDSDTEWCGSTKGKEDTDEISDVFEHNGSTDQENPKVINQEEDEAAKEQHMNGDSGWSNVGGGRKFKFRSSGSVLEQSSQSTFSSFQKSNVVSSGARHKQTRKRNHHHHHQPNRGRRQTGNQLVIAFREMLSESLSFWCISCIHMFIEIIVTLTHNCGVGVETGAVKLYNVGQQIFVKITDVPGMKEDFSRFFKWTKFTVADLVDKTLKSLKCVKTAFLHCFRLCCTLMTLSFKWGNGIVVRIGGERGKHLWIAFHESKFWKRVVSLMDRVRKLFRRGSRVPPYAPESPERAGRSMQGQELERLLALVEVPEEELDPFSVLGVEVDATETELKKAYRQLAVQVGC